MRTLLRRILEPAGYSVVEAGDGLEGLQRFLEGQFGFVLLDWHMPGMGGDGFLQALAEAGLEAKFLVISGRPAEVPPALPCLPKPFSPKELLHRVQAANPPGVGR